LKHNKNYKERKFVKLMNRRKKGMFTKRKGGQGSRNRNNKIKAGPPPDNTPKAKNHSARKRASALPRGKGDLIKDYIWSIKEDLNAYRRRRLGSVQLESQIERNLGYLNSIVENSNEECREDYENLASAYQGLKAERTAVQQIVERSSSDAEEYDFWH
jgi:hypothetical protein